MAALRTLLLVLAAGFPCSRTSECSYFGLLDHLNMTTSNQALKISRPVKNWTSTTLVQLDMVLDGILDMDEKFQTVTNHIWLKMYWINEFLIWNSSEFCGINMLTVPSSMLWTPDIIIQEDSSNDGGSDEDPLVSVFSYGLVILNKRLQLTSACKFDFFRFPFDTQTCNISFSSMSYDESLMKLGKVMSDTLLTEVSEQIMLTAGEWKLVNITIINFTSVTMKSKLVYRISLERKPFLYIINLIVPLLFLLVLDLASFFISDSSSEKLGFKVTILLSIFVLLSIIKDILPSTEESLPLMATYCVLVFTLVWINILETMLVGFLKDFLCCGDEDNRSSEVFQVKTQQEADNHKDSAGVAEAAKAEMVNRPLEGRGDGEMKLRKLIKGKLKPPQTPPERQNSRVGRSGCSRLRLVKIFDSVFFVLYFITVVSSQVFIFALWSSIFQI